MHTHTHARACARARTLQSLALRDAQVGAVACAGIAESITGESVRGPWRSSLTALDLSSNPITHAGVRCLAGALPRSRLVTLRLDGCELVDEDLAVLSSGAAERSRHATSLGELSLEDNQLTVLPRSLCEVWSLHTLNLAGNGLQTLPPQLGELSRLKKLTMASNPGLRTPSRLYAAGELERPGGGGVAAVFGYIRRPTDHGYFDVAEFVQQAGTG